jgi:hypothetical protein
MKNVDLVFATANKRDNFIIVKSKKDVIDKSIILYNKFFNDAKEYYGGTIFKNANIIITNNKYGLLIINYENNIIKDLIFHEETTPGTSNPVYIYKNNQRKTIEDVNILLYYVENYYNYFIKNLDYVTMDIRKSEDKYFIEINFMKDLRQWS